MRNNKKTITTICCIAGAAAIIVGIVFTIKSLKNYLTPEDISGTKLSGNTVSQIDLSKYPYIKDVNYTGPVEFMDVYCYPFQKSSMYKRNKEFDPDTTRTDVVAEVARNFVKSLYSVDYRALVSDKDKYENTVKQFVDKDALFFADAGPITSDEDGMDEYLEKVASLYVENETVTEADFVTDAALVYEDGYFFCRGVIKYDTVKSDKSSDNISCYPVEILLKQNYATDSFDVAGIVGIEGYDSFEVAKNE